MKFIRGALILLPGQSDNSECEDPVVFFPRRDAATRSAAVKQISERLFDMLPAIRATSDVRSETNLALEDVVDRLYNRLRKL